MTATLYCGDTLAVLRTMPDGAARCAVTSPPYWGLRDYGTARWEGGDAECDHLEMATGMSDKNTLGPDGYLPPTNAANVGRLRQFRGACGKCGAVRLDRQYGLEPTPAEYVARMVEVFREVRRVLAEDGTLWLNLGDSYAGYHGNKNSEIPTSSTNGWTNGYNENKRSKERPQDIGLKHKDLIGIPWRVALALQADGWWLRSDIIWSKPNPMPESVTDRPTKAHEYLFLLTKRERYYYDAAAIAEPATSAEEAQWAGTGNGLHSGESHAGAGQSTRRFGKSGNTERKMGEERGRPGSHLGGSVPWEGVTRNARSVWSIATQPYPGAHFATFPEELARRCILAGSAPGDTVLDPFGGSGTVAQVATGNGRRAIHIDLSPAYIELARQRVGPMLCETPPRPTDHGGEG